MSGRVLPTTEQAPVGQGATVGSTAMNNAPAAASIPYAADEALALRDQALAVLDGGDPWAALAIAREGLTALEAGGLASGADAAALLVTVAEIEETVARFGDAAATIAAAIAILDGVVLQDGDDDSLMLWCQAQERLAGLERMAGEFDAAAARLCAVLDRASSALGEVSTAVVSAANALGVVYKYAADFDAAEGAYQRAMTAVDSWPDPDPLILAGLLHNLGGLAHSRGDFTGGIPPPRGASR